MHYDLIIVGGGLVGAGLALALESTKLRIAVIDSRQLTQPDPRLLALNYSSCAFLKNLNLWPPLHAHATPIQQVHVSHQGHFGTVLLDCDEVALDTLGHVIPAAQLEKALAEKLTALTHITLYRPATLITLTQKDGLATLELVTETGKVYLETPIVIAADGTESTVRAQLNITADIFDYEQSAIVTRTTLKRAHHNLAYERFYAEGAIAMLPLVGDECATIWTVNTDTANELMALTDVEFLQVLQKEFGYRLGRLQEISQRHCFPLRRVQTHQTVAQCVLLLGNSAHTVHPIAAQGFNLALYEVAVLVEGIKEKIQQELFFTTSDLGRMLDNAEQQQVLSTQLSHWLVQLFSQRSVLASMALQLGMISLNHAIPIKKKFVNKILGRAGSPPRLLLNGQRVGHEADC